MILALDLARKTGWAVMDKSRAHFGTWDLGPDALMRPDNLEGRLHRTLWHHRPNGIRRVAYEDVRFFRGKSASESYALLCWTTKRFARSYGLPVESYAVTEIKKFAGGGGFDKQQMVLAARARWGDLVADDNQADALFLGALALAKGKQ